MSTCRTSRGRSQCDTCVYICVQEQVHVRGEEFVTSLASLTEDLLHQLDNSLTPAGNSSPLALPESYRKSAYQTRLYETKSQESALSPGQKVYGYV